MIERIKKYVRKLKKSPVLREEFTNIQKLNDLPARMLVKHTEVKNAFLSNYLINFLQVRWSSTFDMLDRFLINESAIKILCMRDQQLPKFTQDDFHIIGVLIEVSCIP
jgi:hypothetical protein